MGRVTQELLLHYFSTVDLVRQRGYHALVVLQHCQNIGQPIRAAGVHAYAIALAAAMHQPQALCAWVRRHQR